MIRKLERAQKTTKASFDKSGIAHVLRTPITTSKL